MRTPMRPVPAAIARWVRRARYLRGLDAACAWLAGGGAVAALFPGLALDVQAWLALLLLVLGALVPALRVRWRPVSGWVGLALTRALRPGDRAWWVQSGGPVSVLVTARRRLRLVIATAGDGEAETLTVRRTRTLILPAADVSRPRAS